MVLLFLPLQNSNALRPIQPKLIPTKKVELYQLTKLANNRKAIKVVK